MLTTLTIFTLQPGTTRWGLAQMGTAPRQLQRVAGLRFFKMLGSGYDFGLKPNFQRYALMAVWETMAAAETFFATHPLWLSYQQHSTETWTVQLAPLKAHGLWDGQNPFDYHTTPAPADGPVAVLTRASIKLWKAPQFWRAVPATSAAFAQAQGVRAAIGLGEIPIVRQATFSVWESAVSMQQYAYRGAAHKGVIQRTRQEKWYGEELFARFQVLGGQGTLDGKNPLEGLV
ncbi:spheroidene monooxygenase [Hymenobacter cellulosilyticus]|uniref:Spheroidene monooxygenase n=1 Tax=Hymenobacter cellulosilyticus TaxID=2932248 RepID=A0A8T9Q5M9_9BACT|nr:spheroidene monooxygenase [Hymenobacter cellulosilyticus]UOQ71080.1 spheroidene monooxygenase [Hymenobacter cellulosilyticus]